MFFQSTTPVQLHKKTLAHCATTKSQVSTRDVRGKDREEEGESNQILLCSGSLEIVEDGIIGEDPVLQGEGKARVGSSDLLNSFSPFRCRTGHHRRSLRENALAEFAVFDWILMKQSRMGFGVFHIVSESCPNWREGWCGRCCSLRILSPSD